MESSFVLVSCVMCAWTRSAGLTYIWMPALSAQSKPELLSSSLLQANWTTAPSSGSLVLSSDIVQALLYFCVVCSMQTDPFTSNSHSTGLIGVESFVMQQYIGGRVIYWEIQKSHT